MRKPRGTPATRDLRDPDVLLDRILATPDLARVIPQLPPEMLHRVVEICGLEDCGELVALATPNQLARVFDIDLWRADRPGLDEHLDADRFGVWLEVLLESGAAVAARKVAAMDADLVIAALAQHLRVIDHAAGVRGKDDGLSCDVGGYRIVARHNGSWDAIVDVLVSLDAQHPGCFHRVMGGCRAFSSSAPEVDGLDDLLTAPEQAMFDLASGREQRRETQGYATPADARAFLQMARHLRRGDGAPPPVNPVASAYFRALEWTTTMDAEADHDVRRLPAASGAAAAPDQSSQAIDGLVGLLIEAGVLDAHPRALLDRPGQAPRLARIQAQLQCARDRDVAAYSQRSHELVYLANTMVAGASIQARPFLLPEATEAAVAVCNLGLENWPGTALADDFLVHQDLVGVFQVGWTVLHEDVCLYAAEHLIAVLTRLRCHDRETQTGLTALRIQLTKQWRAGTPWRARDALEVIATLDMPAWATLLGLIDECPVLHAAIGASPGSGVRAVSASAFEFISENSQIASVRAFLRSLPDALRD